MTGSPVAHLPTDAACSSGAREAMYLPALGPVALGFLGPVASAPSCRRSLSDTGGSGQCLLLPQMISGGTGQQLQQHWKKEEHLQDVP